jgi:prephenate dehydratase/chorismate mutase/prephenate dehydratase
MELGGLRKKIDRIDSEMVLLLRERMELSLRTAKFKETITDEEREKSVMENVRRFSGGLIDPEFSSKMFAEIISESKRVQEKRLKLVGFQGEHGAYGHLASYSYDGNFVPVPCAEFMEVFEGVKKGWFDFGIVPVENSLEGAVTEVNDLLIEEDLTIAGEVKLPIHHCFLALHDTHFEEIKIAYSHPQALAQCRGFLLKNGLEARPYFDTAGAAKMLSRTRPKAAGAIASKLCVELYDLTIAEEGIEDNKSNMTRFAVISNEKNREAGNKCSIVFSTKHKPGALSDVLQLFSEENVNLTRIESRPMKGNPGHYTFLLDFQGSDRNERIQNLLREVQKKTILFKFLGCYKEASP